MRTGRMDVRVLAGGGTSGRREYQRVADAVAAELTKTDERLIRLLGEHWTGFAEGPDSPYMVFRNVAYEAEPTD